MKSIPRNLAVSGDAIGKSAAKKVIALFLCVMQVALLSICKIAPRNTKKKIALMHPDTQIFRGKNGGERS